MKKIKNNLLLDDTLRFILLIAVSLILPLILIPIVKIIGYTEIIEELVKALVIFFIVLGFSTVKKGTVGALILGTLFALSESIFYLNNIFQNGDFDIFWQRLAWTMPLHIITVLIMFMLALKEKKLIVPGFIFAVLVHVAFNVFLA